MPLSSATPLSQLILDSTLEGIWTIDLDGLVSSMNRSGLRMLGYQDVAEVLGRNSHELFHHSHPDGSSYSQLECPIYKAFQKGAPAHLKNEVLWRKDGSSFYADYRSVPILQDQKILGAVVTFTDNTEANRIQSELNRQRAWLSATLSSIGDAVIATTADPIPKIEFLNKVAEDLTGWSLAEAKGVPVERVFDIINAKTREKAVDPILRVLAEGKTVGLANHTALRSRSGREYIIEDSAAPIKDEDGKVSGVVLVFRDATEKYAQEQRSLLLNAVIENSQDFIGIADPNGDSFYLNSAGRALMGAPPAGKVNKTNLLDYFASDEKKRVREEILPRVRNKGSWDGRVLFQHFQNGELIPVSWNVFSIPDSEKGGIAAIACVSRDLRRSETIEREMAEANESVAKAWDELRASLKLLPIGIALFSGPDHTYTFTNPSHDNLLGNRANLIGQTVAAAVPEAKSSGLIDLLDRVYQTGEPYFSEEKELSFFQADGTLRAFIVQLSYQALRRNNGDIYGVVASVVDLSEEASLRKQLSEKADQALRAEAQLQKAVQVAKVGFFDWNIKTNHLRFSEQFQKDWGLNPGESNEEAFLSILPEDKPLTEKLIQQAIDEKKPYKAQYRVRRPSDQKVIWIEAEGRVSYDEKGEPDFFFGTSIDITERKQFEAEISQAHERAEQASSAKSAFLANMSHEIRTPLAAIMGFTNLLRRSEGIPEGAANFVEIIDRNSHHLLRIIDDILDLAKVEAGKMDVEKIHFSFRELVSDFSSLMALRAREKGIEFAVSAATPIPEFVLSDPTRLRQIFTNIVGNAIKFTEIGSVRVTLRFNGEKLEFSVADTGRGISEEQAGALFQAFMQADSSTTRKFGGTGLGLALTRKLSNLMGGDFYLERSALGTGSVFTAALPIEMASNSPFLNTGNLSSDRAVMPKPMNTQELLGRKVLVVDDSHDNRVLLGVLFTAAGAKVEFAQDGLEAVEKASGSDFDLVLMDIQMPGLDGYQAFERLRKKNFPSPVIALTAHAMVEEREKVAASGFAGFSPKPVDWESLLKLVLSNLAPSAPASSLAPKITRPEKKVLIVEDDEDIRSLLSEIAGECGFEARSVGSGVTALDALSQGFAPGVMLIDLSLPDFGGDELIRQIREQKTGKEPDLYLISGWQDLPQRAEALGVKGFLKKPINLAKLESILRAYGK